MATFRVTHATHYRYDSEVSSGYGELHLLPRDLPRQRCRTTSVVINPAPHDLRHRTDFFGNRAGFFTIMTPHTELSVTTTSVVDIEERNGVLPIVTNEQLDHTVEQFRLNSPLVVASAELAALAAPSFAAERSALDAVLDLSTRIHREFDYEPGATTIATPLREVLEQRAGVCQDFAHLFVGCARSVGLAARYVSGYLETDPPKGKKRLVGADLSHAWASVWVPGAGWVDIDPTNDGLTTERHITTAWGRDYQDVAPLKGVIFTESTTQELTVSVDVARVLQ